MTSTAPVTPPSSTPIRRGHTFCSPACGVGCTWEAHQRAQRRAADLVTALPGWTSRVWENVGWHAAAKSPDGFYKVHSRRGSFTCLLGTDPVGGTWVGRGQTPAEAIEDARAKARTWGKQWSDLIATLGDPS